MTNDHLDDQERSQELEELAEERSSGRGLGFALLGVLVGVGLTVLVVRNPLGFELLQPVAGWLGGGSAAVTSASTDDGRLGCARRSCGGLGSACNSVVLAVGRCQARKQVTCLRAVSIRLPRGDYPAGT